MVCVCLCLCVHLGVYVVLCVVYVCARLCVVYVCVLGCVQCGPQYMLHALSCSFVQHQLTTLLCQKTSPSPPMSTTVPSRWIFQSFMTRPRNALRRSL